MTEEDWFAATDPTIMFEFANKNDRKLRLFVVALSYLFWDELKIEELRSAIITNEKYADGFATDDELSKARNSAHTMGHHIRWYWQHEPRGFPQEDPIERKRITDILGTPTEDMAKRSFFVAFMTSSSERLRRDKLPMLLTDPSLYKNGISLIRDIFGNPFRPITLNPSWLSSTVLALATGIYEEKAFDRMPILADALQDAGCDNQDILNHCRQPGVHVKGCWVVDLLLNKK